MIQIIATLMHEGLDSASQNFLCNYVKNPPQPHLHPQNPNIYIYIDFGGGGRVEINIHVGNHTRYHWNVRYG